jgi:flagellar basal body-associated protein FliL
LSSAARTLTIVLLVVGAVAFVAYVALFGSSVRFSSSISASIESSIAAASTQAAYDALESPTNTFVSATKSCRANSVDVTDELQCLQSADRAFAGAIEGYQTSLSQIVYPSSAQVEADAAVAAARSVDAILHSLVTAPDAQSYTAISTGSAFTSSLHALDSTYNQLMTTLNG